MARKKQPEESAEPPEFSDLVAASICSKIATGLPLDRACAAVHSKLTSDVVYLWMYRSAEFSALYREAKRSAMFKYLEDTVEIADDDSVDTYTAKTKDGDEYEAPNSAAVNRAKLRVETRKWAMQTLSREIFGDKPAPGGGEGGETTIKIVGGLPD